MTLQAASSRVSILLVLNSLLKLSTSWLLSVNVRLNIHPERLTWLRLRAVLEERAARQRVKPSVVRLKGKPERSRWTMLRLEEMASSKGNDQHTSEGKSPPLSSRLRWRVLREVLASKQSDMHNRSSGEWRTTERVARRQLVLERAFPSC